MKIVRIVLLSILAVWLLPSYLLAAYLWRDDTGKWARVNILRYAEFSKDLLSYIISFLVWFVLLCLGTLVYNAF